MRLEIQTKEVVLSPNLIARIESKFSALRRRSSRKVMAIHVLLSRVASKGGLCCLLVVQLRRRRQWAFQAVCDDILLAVDGAWQRLHNEPQLVPLALPPAREG